MTTSASKCERPVVVAGAHAEAVPGVIEADQGDEDQVQELGLDGRALLWLGDAVAVRWERIAGFRPDEAEAACSRPEYRQEDLAAGFTGRSDVWPRVEFGIDSHERSDAVRVSGGRAARERRCGGERRLLTERPGLGAPARAQGPS